MPPPKKSLSQNFLSDPRILSRIADAVRAGKEDTVLEIGAGRGALTRELVRRIGRMGRIVALERDGELIPELELLAEGLRTLDSQDSRPTTHDQPHAPRTTDHASLTIHHADALEADWHQLAGPDFLVAGNIPYHITSPLIDKALTPPRPRVVVFLVQKEVAERLAAAPGSEDYGALTIGVQAVAQVEMLFVVPRGAFHPVPKVDSAVVRFIPLKRPLIEDQEVAGFRRFTVGMFSYRRKQLARGIRELTGFSAEQATRVITHALASMPIEGEEVYPPIARPTFKPESRPEEVAPLGMVSLYRAVVEAGWEPKA